MRKFTDFVYESEQEEMFLDESVLDLLTENFEGRQPKDGFWINADSDGSPVKGYNSFFFNVDGDDCSKCQRGCEENSKNRVYKVNISGGESISISFYRCGFVSDVKGEVYRDVIGGVQSAIAQYVLLHKPQRLTWSAVSKSDSMALNPEARASIYDRWSVRHLFPDKYVRGEPSTWVRRDIYDSVYVGQRDAPPVPDWVKADSNPGEKARAMEEMRAKELENMSPEMRQMILDREKEEEERKKAHNLRVRALKDAKKAKIESDVHNPNKIKVDDIVYFRARYTDRARVGKVKSFSLGLRSYSATADDPLYGEVEYFDSDFLPMIKDGELDLQKSAASLRNDTVKASDLKKYDNEVREQMKSKVKASSEMVASTEKNPNKIEDGDEIITYVPNNMSQTGLRGKVDYMQANLSGRPEAFVKWDDQASSSLGSRIYSPVNVGFLFKDTPEERTRIQNLKRDHEVEKRVAAQRGRGRTPQTAITPLSDPSLVNHPDNPNGIKPGDVVTMPSINSVPLMYWNKKFVVTQMQATSYGGINATLKPVVGRSSSITVGRLDILQKDTSPEAAEVAARAERRQAMQSSREQQMGGHSIGDTVSIVSGMHRGKTGRIVGFRMQRGVLNAVVALPDGVDARVKIASLQPPASSPAPTAEGFSFSGFLALEEYMLNRR